MGSVAIGVLAPMGRAAGLVLLAALAAGPVGAETAEHPPGSQAQTELIVARFKERFAVVGPQLADGVEQLYAPKVRFRDPITAVEGREALRAYLAHFGETAAGARFTITDTFVQPGSAAVFWTMTFAAEEGESTGAIQGVSLLRVRERVYEERDYFDLGEVYDQVPVLNWFTGLVKSRFAP